MKIRWVQVFAQEFVRWLEASHLDPHFMNQNLFFTVLGRHSSTIHATGTEDESEVGMALWSAPTALYAIICHQQNLAVVAILFKKNISREIFWIGSDPHLETFQFTWWAGQGYRTPWNSHNFATALHSKSLFLTGLVACLIQHVRRS